jgi:hypothetical protein
MYGGPGSDISFHFFGGNVDDRDILSAMCCAYVCVCVCVCVPISEILE